MLTRVVKKELKDFSKEILNNELAYRNKAIRAFVYYRNIRKSINKLNRNLK